MMPRSSNCKLEKSERLGFHHKLYFRDVRYTQWAAVVLESHATVVQYTSPAHSNCKYSVQFASFFSPPSDSKRLLRRRWFPTTLTPSFLLSSHYHNDVNILHDKKYLLVRHVRCSRRIATKKKGKSNFLFPCCTTLPPL